jgi:isopenicillin-N epimerase
MRDLFLLDPDVVFLNHGSFGACPKEVLDACQSWQREMERNPVEFLGRRSARLLADARAALAALVGARADSLVFVPNATTGVNTVARSLPLRPGDEILTTDHEYGACDATWDWVSSRTGARVVRAPVPLPFDSSGFTDRIWSHVTPRTRVLTLSHVTSTTALVFPIAELIRRARERGILTLVDGAHAPGQIPLALDSLGADFYTGNCHKWLCAPKGAGFLHSRPEHHALLEAPIVSWGYCAEVSGHTDFDAYTGATLLERRLQWQGTRDLSAYLSVPAAIEFQRRHEWHEVRRRCHELAAETLARITRLTGLEPVCREGDFAQMVVIPVPRMDPSTLKSVLFERYRIEVPVTLHGGRLFVRLSVQGYNGRADLDALVAALAEIVGAAPSPLIPVPSSI